MDGQDAQDEGGPALLEPEAEAPGPVDVDAFVEVIAGTEVGRRKRKAEDGLTQRTREPEEDGRKRKTWMDRIDRM